MNATKEQMITFITKRERSGFSTTMRDLTKRFSMSMDAALEEIGQGVSTGFRQQIVVLNYGEEVTGKTVLQVENVYVNEEELATLEAVANQDAAESTKWDTVAQVAETSPEAAALMATFDHKAFQAEMTAAQERIANTIEDEDSREQALAVIESYAAAKVAGTRKVDPLSYETFATVEAAEAALGYKLIKVSVLHKLVVGAGKPVGRMVKAMGGDRGYGEPKAYYWKPVLVKGARYVAAVCEQDISEL